MDTLLIKTKTKEQSKIFENLAKALKVPIKKNPANSPYNPAFVAKIKKSEKNFETGKHKKVKIDSLWK